MTLMDPPYVVSGTGELKLLPEIVHFLDNGLFNSRVPAIHAAALTALKPKSAKVD